VAAGLACTEAGDDVLYVETVLLPDGKDLVMTGQLGSVMQESGKAAQGYIASRAGAFGIAEATRQGGVQSMCRPGRSRRMGPRGA